MYMNKPAYKIKTERLVIRSYEPKDAYMLKEAIDASAIHLSQWLPWAKKQSEEIQDKIQRIRKYRANFDLDKDYYYGIFLSDSLKFIGSLGLKSNNLENASEIGYWLHVDYINKGYALEATSAIVKVAFEVNGVDKIEIRCDVDNERSSAIPKKLGFNKEAVIRINERDENGKRKHDEVWVLFQEEYESSSLVSFPVEAFDVVDMKIL